MYIKRIAEQTLVHILNGSKVGIVLGARQVGKTTLVEHVLAGRNACSSTSTLRLTNAGSWPPLLAHQVGNEVSTHELATQLQIARQTVERYLDLLEETYVIFRLPAFSTNPRKEIAKGKKVFFWDTGIRNALLNAFSTEEFRPDIGVLWENWVIAEAAKHNLLQGCPSELFFWRSRANRK